MKLKSFLSFLAIAALTLAGCETKEEEDLGEAAISVNPEEVTFVATNADSQTVNLTATRDWRVTSKPDWVFLDVKEGDGSSKAQKISVSVENNTGFDREGDVVFSIGIRPASLKVKQAGAKGELKAEGEGTQESPYNVVGAIEYVQGLGADVASENEVYIKGVVSQIEEEFSFSYGNGTFFISDDGELTTPKFYVFRVYYIDGKNWTIVNPQIAVGDTVVVLSKVVNYAGNTPETVMRGAKDEGGKYNGHIYSINGKTEAQEVEPDFSQTPSKTIKEFKEAANKSEFFVLNGKVLKFNANYCSFDLVDDTDTIYVYSVANADAWKETLANKGTVKLAGVYDFYQEKHEVVSAWIMGFTPAPEQTEFDNLTVAEFIRKADAEVGYRLTGKVSKFTKGVNKQNVPYMQFNLTDDSGSITVYGFRAGEYDKWNEVIENKGTVTLHGIYEKYVKDGAVTHEVVDCVIENFEPAPEQTVFEEISIAEFISKADTLVGYKLHGTVSSFSFNETQKQMQFELTDESKQTVVAYGFKAGQYEEWHEKLSNGGTAVIHGLYEKYVGKDGVVKHEVVDAVVEGFEAAAAVEEQPEGDGTLESPYNVLGVKAFIDADDFATSGKDKNVYVTGKVCKIVKAFAAGTAAQFWISSDGGEVAAQFEAYNVKYLGNKDWVEGQRALVVGDEVVLYGKVTKYNSTYETSSNKAYVYSINGNTEDDSPLFGVVSNTVNVAASATSATVKVTGNVQWTARNSENCEITPNTGTGAGDITVTFAANEDTENAKTYTVTLITAAEVATKTITVTITQAKKSAGGEPTKLSVTFSEKAAEWGYKANGDQIVSLPLGDGVVLSVNKDGNNGKFYSGGAEWRLYQSNKAKVTLTVPEGKSLVSVKFTFDVSNGGALKGTGNAFGSNEVQAVSGTTASFDVVSTNAGTTNAQVKMKAIEVEYQ